MYRKSASTIVVLALTTVLFVTGTVGARAGEEPIGTAPVQLPELAEADTVRTNLWLTEALMGEIVTAATSSLPFAPGAVLLVDQGGSEQDELFGVVAAGILSSRGYDLFVIAGDSTVQAPVDFVFSYEVVGVELAYPAVGRTLGIWRRWVARDVAVTVSVEVSIASSGQLLFKDNVERRFSDRVDNDAFKDVESDLYEFTTAETASSGWQGRMETVVVLGTLVGLIAIYFANTGS